MTDLNRLDIPQRYFVDDLPGANIPATRLRNVLDALEQGHPLSALALKYLQAQVKSAICATHGGVMRDLDRLDDALALVVQAQALTPGDFRPCTLLGAVNIELGNLSIGWDWYGKAEERGASERSIDYDLRGIFLRTDDARRLEIRAFFLREDPARYAWVDDFNPERSRARRA